MGEVWGPTKYAISTVLLVEDDRMQLNAWTRELRGRNPIPSTTRAEALAIARQQRIDLAIVDLRLGRDHGVDVVRDLKAIDPTTVVALVSCDLTVTQAVAATHQGADYVLPKPVRPARIVAAIETGATLVDDRLDRRLTLQQVEHEYIDLALETCGNNVTQAADQLGLHRTTLRRKLEKRGWRAPSP